ncbi:DUF5362 family protein [Pedobacter sp.]|uniref:DUF5362 family protein n=1 Tax=Pedobacter sp. TaxID=1411316 RepID=UPI003D7F908C
MDNIEETVEDTPMDNPEKPLIITEDVRSYLYETSKWTKFLSILGFVFTAMIALFAFGSGAFISLLSKYSPGSALGAMGSGFLTVYFLVMAMLYFYPSLMLFKNSKATQKAVLYGDQESLSAAMLSMKSFFKFWGVLMIVLIVFYVLVLLMAIVVGMSAANMAS